MSCQNKFTSPLFSALITRANDAAVTDKCNYMTNKTCMSLEKQNNSLVFFQQKVSRRKLRFFIMLFLENEVQIDKNNYRTMLFRSKQVSLPKSSSILQNNYLK